MTEKIFFLGNKEILKNYKIAFLCSRKIPAKIVLKSYDWAIAQREKGNCVISGFHSQIEKDVLHYLLKGKQPIILVLARGLTKRLAPELKPSVTNGRLLIITPFDETVTKVTPRTAGIRNRLMAKLADEICIAHSTPGGNITKLVSNFNDKKVKYLSKINREDKGND